MTDAVISDVDASSLFVAMPESSQRAVRDAWRNAEPASIDGVTAAVAVHRIEKQRRFFWVQAIGWFVVVVLSVATLDTNAVVRVAVALLPAGLAAWAGYALARSGRNRGRLAAVADPDAAAQRAAALRATSSAGRPADAV